MKRFLAGLFLAFLLAVFVLGLWLGMRWQRLRYIDACLQAGGQMKDSSLCLVK